MVKIIDERIHRVNSLKNQLQKLNREDVFNLDYIIYKVRRKDKLTLIEFKNKVNQEHNYLISLEQSIRDNDEYDEKEFEENLFNIEYEVSLLSIGRKVQYYVSIILILLISYLNIHSGFLKATSSIISSIETNLGIDNLVIIIVYTIIGLTINELSFGLDNILVRALFIVISVVVFLSFVKIGEAKASLSINVTPELIAFIFGYSTKKVFYIVNSKINKKISEYRYEK